MIQRAACAGWNAKSSFLLRTRGEESTPFWVENPISFKRHQDIGYEWPPCLSAMALEHSAGVSVSFSEGVDTWHTRCDVLCCSPVAHRRNLTFRVAGTGCYRKWRISLTGSYQSNFIPWCFRVLCNGKIERLIVDCWPHQLAASCPVKHWGFWKWESWRKYKLESLSHLDF